MTLAYTGAWSANASRVRALHGWYAWSARGGDGVTAKESQNPALLRGIQQPQVVIVDDEPILVELVLTTLVDAAIEAQACPHGRRALACLRAKMPTVAIGVPSAARTTMPAAAGPGLPREPPSNSTVYVSFVASRVTAAL